MQGTMSFRMAAMYLKKNRIPALVCVCLFITIFVYYEISKRDSAVATLELQLSQLQHGRHHYRSLTASGEEDYFSDEDTVVIYNRVPKTGSTSFAGIAYELCGPNKFYMLHVNTTKNMHTLSVQDQMRFIQNITEWTERKPAIYHGHFYYIDFAKLGYNQRQPVYINVIRKPLDRLLSYYYFMRYGDNYRPNLRRRKMGNQMTFDECVEEGHKDCDPTNLWMQIPFFCGHTYRCRQAGSRWALEQAKSNLINKYLLVGVTEELRDFIAMLEVTLPRFFHGASDLYLNTNLSHRRITNKKLMPNEDNIAKIQQSTIWKMEHEFYEFALEQFHFQRRLTFQSIDSLNTDGLKESLEVENKRTFLLSDGRLYIDRRNKFHYEKIRPR